MAALALGAYTPATALATTCRLAITASSSSYATVAAPSLWTLEVPGPGATAAPALGCRLRSGSSTWL